MLKYFFQNNHPYKANALIFCAFFLFFHEGRTQSRYCEYEINIKLLNAVSKIPLKNIEVYLESNHILNYTDSAGRVRFSSLKDSNQLIDIILPDTHFHKHYILSCGHPSLTDIIYISNRSFLDYEKLPGINIDRTESPENSKHSYSTYLEDVFGSSVRNEKNLSEFSTSLNKLLLKLPMIQTSQAGGTIAKPIIQGMSGIRAPLFWNGTRIEGQNWGGDHAPEISLFGDESIELKKGCESLKYGADLWGNMVNIKNDFALEPNQFNYNQNTEFQSNGKGYKVTGILNVGLSPKHKIHAYYLKLSGFTVGDYSVPNGILSNTGMNEISIASGLKFKKSDIHVSFYQSKIGIYTGSHIGNITDLYLAMHSEIPQYTVSKSTYQIGFPNQLAKQISVVWNAHLTSRIKSEISYQKNSRQEYAITRTGNSDIPQIDIDQNTINQKLDYSVNRSFQFGLNQQFVVQRYASNYLVPEYNGYKLGGFVSKDWNTVITGKTLKHELLIRYDYLNRYGFEYLNRSFKQNDMGFSGGYSFIANGSTRLTQKKILEIHLTQIWRPASPNELYSFGIHHGSAAFEQGDSRLKPETGEKIDVNFEFSTSKLQNSWNFIVNFFGQYSPNFILLTPQKEPILTVKGAFPAFKYSQQKTIYSGIEIFARFVKRNSKNESMWSFENKSNFQFGKLINGGYPIGIPASFVSFQFQTRIHSKIVWGISANHVFKQFFYSAGSDFLDPPQAYTLFKTELKTRNIKHWEFGIFVDNLSNVKYRSYTDRFRYFVDMPGRNIGLKVLYQIHHHNKHLD